VRGNAARRAGPVADADVVACEKVRLEVAATLRVWTRPVPCVRISSTLQRTCIPAGDRGFIDSSCLARQRRQQAAGVCYAHSARGTAPRVLAFLHRPALVRCKPHSLQLIVPFCARCRARAPIDYVDLRPLVQPYPLQMCLGGPGLLRAPSHRRDTPARGSSFSSAVQEGALPKLNYH